MSTPFMEILSGRHLMLIMNNDNICIYERNCIMRETYENLEIETIVFEVEDILTTSMIDTGGED